MKSPCVPTCQVLGTGAALNERMQSKEVEISDIESKIYLIRGEKVMLDSDLADLYQVPTMRLNEQVKRNLRRFPPDFMFSLSDHEFRILKPAYALDSSRGLDRI